MINLLPLKEKKEFLMEGTKRMVIVLWFLFLFFLVCLALILLSIKIYLQGQIDSNKNYLANTEKEFLESESEEYRSRITEANSKIEELNSFYEKRVNFSNVLEKVSALLPADIYLTDVSLGQITEDKERKIVVALSGFAPVVDDVVEFENNLKGEFENVDFPLSNWVKEKDIDIYVTFKIPL